MARPLSFVLAKLSPKPVGLALFAVFRGQGSSSVRKKCRVKCDGFDKTRVGEEVKAEVKVPAGVERASKVVFSWEACDGGGTPSGGAKDFTVNLSRNSFNIVRTRLPGRNSTQQMQFMYEIGAPREGVEGKDDNIFFKDTNKASYMEITVKLTGGVEKVGGGKFLESGMVKLVLCNLNEFGEPEEWKDTQDQARTAPLVVSESTCNNSGGGSRGKGRPYIRMLGFSDEENNDNDDETSSSGWIRFRIEEISKGNWWCLKVQGTGKLAGVKAAYSERFRVRSKEPSPRRGSGGGNGGGGVKENPNRTFFFNEKKMSLKEQQKTTQIITPELTSLASSKKEPRAKAPASRRMPSRQGKKRGYEKAEDEGEGEGGGGGGATVLKNPKRKKTKSLLVVDTAPELSHHPTSAFSLGQSPAGMKGMAMPAVPQSIQRTLSSPAMMQNEKSDGVSFIREEEFIPMLPSRSEPFLSFMSMSRITPMPRVTTEVAEGLRFTVGGKAKAKPMPRLRKKSAPVAIASIASVTPPNCGRGFTFQAREVFSPATCSLVEDKFCIALMEGEFGAFEPAMNKKDAAEILDMNLVPLGELNLGWDGGF
ncbi:hypothetical protein TL16_g05904 [Triparma laevis f. inornata]|uniref:Uncharacterized protein n=1 Tax=Triparma laevis f. inornata TaxID=1714386 RepID=A0A9W7EBA8_9STRA|nr:hypothetical protein TL16_g05904 [Triparma laevis f. inornata]